MSQKCADTDAVLADHERRLMYVEKAVDGSDRHPGLVEKVRALEDVGLASEAKRAAVVAVISALIALGPMLGMVLPELRAMREELRARPAAVRAP